MSYDLSSQFECIPPPYLRLYYQTQSTANPTSRERERERIRVPGRGLIRVSNERNKETTSSGNGRHEKKGPRNIYIL